jgi:hypothetical protein
VAWYLFFFIWPHAAIPIRNMLAQHSIPFPLFISLSKSAFTLWLPNQRLGVSMPSWLSAPSLFYRALSGVSVAAHGKKKKKSFLVSHTLCSFGAQVCYCNHVGSFGQKRT